MGYAQEYLLFVFLACCGALQLAASLSRLEGLFLLPHRALTGLTGLALEVLAFVWFFGSRNRSVPDTVSGLAGAQLFALFLVGCGAALTVTLVVTSLVNPARRRGLSDGAVGLEALREVTYFRALQLTLRRRWALWRKRTRQ